MKSGRWREGLPRRSRRRTHPQPLPGIREGSSTCPPAVIKYTEVWCQRKKGTAAAVPFRVASRLPGSALGELIRGRALVRIARRMGRIAQAGMLPRRVGVAGRLVAGAADDRQLTSVEF